jgi:hypothetical protein
MSNLAPVNAVLQHQIERPTGKFLAAVLATPSGRTRRLLLIPAPISSSLSARTDLSARWRRSSASCFSGRVSKGGQDSGDVCSGPGMARDQTKGNPRFFHIHLRGFFSSITAQVAAAVIPPSATSSKTSSGVPIGVILSNSSSGTSHHKRDNRSFHSDHLCHFAILVPAGTSLC